MAVVQDEKEKHDKNTLLIPTRSQETSKYATHLMLSFEIINSNVI